MSVTSGESKPPEELLLFKIVSVLSMSSVDGVFGIVLKCEIQKITYNSPYYTHIHTYIYIYTNM